MESDAQSAITALFEAYADSIYRFASFSLPSHIDAKDVVQEVFLKAYRSWGTFREGASPRTWLYQIAKNHIRDVLRKHRSDQRKEAFLLTHNPSIAGLGSMLEYKELLRELPVIYRNVLVLRAMEDLSFDEIADALGCSTIAVRVRYHRARSKMQELISEGRHVLHGKR